MNFIVFAIVAFFSFLVGIFAFAQIVGSLQNFKTRGIGMTLFTITLWVLILFVVWMLVMNFLPSYKILFYGATGISLLVILGSGKIK